MNINAKKNRNRVANKIRKNKQRSSKNGATPQTAKTLSAEATRADTYNRSPALASMVDDDFWALICLLVFSVGNQRATRCGKHRNSSTTAPHTTPKTKRPASNPVAFVMGVLSLLIMSARKMTT